MLSDLPIVVLVQPKDSTLTAYYGFYWELLKPQIPKYTQREPVAGVAGLLRLVAAGCGRLTMVLCMFNLLRCHRLGVMGW